MANENISETVHRGGDYFDPDSGSGAPFVQPGPPRISIQPQFQAVPESFVPIDNNRQNPFTLPSIQDNSTAGQLLNYSNELYKLNSGSDIVSKLRLLNKIKPLIITLEAELEEGRRELLKELGINLVETDEK